MDLTRGKVEMEFKALRSQLKSREIFKGDKGYLGEDGWVYYWYPEMPEKHLHRIVYVEQCSNCGYRPDEEVRDCEQCLQDPANWEWRLIAERWKWNSG